MDAGNLKPLHTPPMVLTGSLCSRDTKCGSPVVVPATHAVLLTHGPCWLGLSNCHIFGSVFHSAHVEMGGSPWKFDTTLCLCHALTAQTTVALARTAHRRACPGLCPSVGSHARVLRTVFVCRKSIGRMELRGTTRGPRNGFWEK